LSAKISNRFEILLLSGDSHAISQSCTRKTQRDAKFFMIM